jgi:hypothetical protein
VIIKGNQRGGGQLLAAHLMNARDNDHVELHEVRGFLSNDLAGAYREVEAAAEGTRCQQPFFAVSLNPPKGHNAAIEDFENAADLIEAKFPGLKGQPRTLIFHEKEGRRHAHAVWSRITERGLAVQLSHSREKLRDVSRAMYAAMGIEAPAGIRERHRADPLNYDIHTWQQAKRLGEDPRDLKAIIQQAWAVSDDRASFERALEQNALYLARGDRRGFVIVHHTGEAMSLTRYGGLGTRELKARLGPPEHLRTVDQVRTTLTDHTTAAAMRRGRDMRDRHRSEFQPLAAEHQRMKAAHRAQRQTVDRQQAERGKVEAQGRAARLRKGVMGLWDRLSGKRGKVSEQNAREIAACKVRDRAEHHAVVEAQMQERGELQGRIMHMRERHRHDRQYHRAELAAMLSMINDHVRVAFTDHAHDMEQLRKPPTAEQRRKGRRDRAEKRGTMPVIVDSDRMRSRRARTAENDDSGRSGGEAENSPVEGREAGTGETAPENEQATHAQPEATPQPDFPQGQESTPTAAPERTEAEREAAIQARLEKWRQERERSNDNDPGREMT